MSEPEAERLTLVLTWTAGDGNQERCALCTLHQFPDEQVWRCGTPGLVVCDHCFQSRLRPLADAETKVEAG